MLTFASEWIMDKEGAVESTIDTKSTFLAIQFFYWSVLCHYIFTISTFTSINNQCEGLWWWRYLNCHYAEISRSLTTMHCDKISHLTYTLLTCLQMQIIKHCLHVCSGCRVCGGLFCNIIASDGGGWCVCVSLSPCCGATPRPGPAPGRASI